MKRIGLMTALSVLLLSVSACSGNGGNAGSSPSAANGQNGPSAGATQTGASTDGKGAGAGAGAGTDAPAPAREEIKLPSGPVKLVVASFEPSEQLKQAVKKYEHAHPNVTVELQAAQTEFKDLDSQIANIEKYVASTNTALLSGKGPDVMELDLLPKEKLVGRGLLANLGDWMDRDAAFNKADYFANVLDNMQIAGGLYAMPLSFYPVALLGDEAAIVKDGGVKDDGDWTWDEFAESAQRLIQKGTHPHALANSPDYMLSELAGERYAQFVDEAGRRANFDSPDFAELMTQVKQLFDDGVVIDLKKANFRSESMAENPKINTYFQSTQIPLAHGVFNVNGSIWRQYPCLHEAACEGDGTGRLLHGEPDDGGQRRFARQGAGVGFRQVPALRAGRGRSRYLAGAHGVSDQQNRLRQGDPEAARRRRGARLQERPCGIRCLSGE
ncbi:extracellular solute-binding protein [Cohnella ginsengisoli]|uniref:Extracellular solute-binding protein n=1 Tax=Cohnella ginsengisoli TaxID=425004 RepID=A0A9X4KKP9_9BACL|nr:extracellular solute-binding protein [Cohnella ginsengisoli]MDG0793992.1 extracellular solute-binding protein [Cohnella ginsengisoli]